MKKEMTQVIVLAKLVLMALWPMSAYAASVTFGDQMAQIPLLAMVMTLILSTLSGVTALLHTLVQEYKANGHVERLWLFVCSKMLGSNLAGIAMFFIAESGGLNHANEAMAIIAASFAGTWFIERLVQKTLTPYLPDQAKKNE